MDATQQNKEMDIIKRMLAKNETVVSLPEPYGIKYLILENEHPSKWAIFTRIPEMKTEESTAQFRASDLVSGVKLYEITGLPFIVIAAWNDAICSLRVWNADAMKLDYHPTGEPVYQIPASHFAVRYLRKD